MVGLDGGGVDDEGGVLWDGLFALIEVDVEGVLLEGVGGWGGSGVRALDECAAGSEESCEARHAAAADADEVDVLGGELFE